MTCAAGSRARPVWRRIARRAGKLWLTWRFRDFDPSGRPERRVKVAGLHLRVMPDVFDPSLHFTSGALAEWLKRPGVVTPGAHVLDLGTGSGILAIASALAGAGPIVALDMNPAAVECARLNARRYGVLGQVDVRAGDMFEPVAGEAFDLVLVNPPYFRGEAPDVAHQAYMAGSDLRWIRRMAQGLPGVLGPEGLAVMVLGDATDIPAITGILRDTGLQTRTAGLREYIAETVHFIELRPERK